MIKVYTGFKGFAVLFLFIAGMFLFLSIFFWGISEVIQLFKPLLFVLSNLLIIVFSLGFLPATFIKDLRPQLAKYSVWMAHALGISTWVVCLFFVINAFGLLGVLFAFLFQFLVPIALVGAILKGAWHDAGFLALWIVSIYGMRFYSRWLVSLDIRERKDGDIIDVDAIEVQNS